MNYKLRITNYGIRINEFVIRNLTFVILSAFCFLSSSFCFSQADPYWNGWIDLSGNQKYYKMLVDSNGIYRLDSLTLAHAGINLSTIDSRNFQIFFRGKEQFIYVADKNGNDTLNKNDYIEFYGQKNDGSLDSVMYKGDLYNQPVRQPNPYYSLFNDTSAYFLTWNSSISNKRITLLAGDTVYSALPNSTPYFLKQDIIENHSEYYTGNSNQFDIHFPKYEESEGWSGGDFYAGSNYAATFNTSNLYPTLNASVEIKFAVMGESNDLAFPINNHIIEVTYHSSVSGYTPIASNTFTGYQLFNSTVYQPASLFQLSSTDVVISALTGNFNVSRNTVPYVTMKFPHTPNLENKNYFEMYVPDDPSQQQSNFTFTNDTISTAYLYDLTNHVRIPITKSVGIYKSLVPNLGGEKFCVVKSEHQFLTIPSIKPVGGTGYFINYAAMAADSAFIIITNKNLMGVNPNDGVNAYKKYRADGSAAGGGGHNVIAADIDDLYDEFGYGIPKFPFSIRHFVDYCLHTFTTPPHNLSPPQNLFLIGKSVQPDLIRNRSAYSDPSGSNYAISFVPTIAFPPCDNMLVAGLYGTHLESPVPIGRLAAKSISEVNTYLAKVKEYEHPPLPNPDEWMKHAIFISGGDTPGLQSQLAGFVRSYANTLADTSFGGYGHIFSKNSSSPTQTSFSDSIKGLINSGVSLITFFGHSGGTVFDFNILPPDQYTNINGKYPFFLALGCNAGDIHQSPYSGGISSSEIYTLSDHGMIAVLASSGPGTTFELDQFTTRFYKGIGSQLYGKSVGKNIQAAFKSWETADSLYPLMDAAILEMTLHGDPSIIIHSSKLPDYAISTSSVYFSPSYVSTDQDSFNVHIVIDNIGKATKNKVKTEVKRYFADGTSAIYSKTLPHIYFKDTLTIRMPVDPIKGPGLNKFEVHVDSGYVIQELQYANNDISLTNAVSLMIYSGDIIPVYPYEYAIIPNNTVTLKANTANPFATSARYKFEIDTTDQFNSTGPQHKIAYVKQAGSVVKVPFNGWAPYAPLLLTDSTVYYWRVRRDTTDFVNFHWRESSFQYISGKRGWGQSHFFQFLKGDRFQYLDTNRIHRRFDLENQNHLISVETLNWSKKFSSSGVDHYSEIWFYMDGLEHTLYSVGSLMHRQNPILYPYASVLVSVLDPITGVAWKNTGPTTGIYGSIPNNGNEAIEFFTHTPAQQETLKQFLDLIPCGYKVIFYTADDHNLGDLVGGNSPHTNPGLVHAFQSIGGTQFPNIRNDLPYILIGRKCGSAIEKFGDSLTSTILLSDTFPVKRDSGMIFSETVGPASKWNSFHWRYVSPEQNTDPAAAAYDTMTVSVVGIRNNGTTDTLIKHITKNSFDIYNLDLIIKADTFPNLQLLGYVKDRLRKTPPQLKKWQVYYDGVPEVSLNPVKYYSFHNPALQQGDSVKFSVAIENIGDYNMDSMWVDSWIYDATRQVRFKSSTKLKPLHTDSFLIANAKFSTVNLPGGQNSVWMEANPFNPTKHHQLEQYHFNNIGTVPFTVSLDKINPLLDVTFDGVHIMNGDIVSAKPNIIIKVKDENTFLAVDTSGFQIFLKRPSQSTFERIYLRNLAFTPAVLPNNNSCKVNYTPAFSDGVYQLKVQAKDKSGNFSGSNEYNVSYEVINKPTVTHVLNYPNPFSTSTRFVFMLTGSVVPDYFKIQILTITGKMVKEVDKFELGPIHIGRNITDYAWDGKDMFGDQLANGIYLYRVITQLDGKSLEQRDSGADPFFVHDYGKMYLIR